MSASMTRRLFVCHAHAEIESTSEVVDALEQGLDFPPGSLWASSLPGYAADPNDDALRTSLAATNIVLALVSSSSSRDPQFNFELGASWLLGLHTIVVSFADVEDAQLPNVLRDAPVVRIQYATDWAQLIGDVSLRLGLVPRAAAARAPSLAQALPAKNTRAAQSIDEQAATILDDIADALADLPDRMDLRDMEDARSKTITHYPQPIFSNDKPLMAAAPPPPPPSLAAAPLRLELPEDPRFGENDEDYFDDVQETTAAGPRAAQLDSDPGEPLFSSDVFTRLPTCEDALEAGRAVSDCLFNRHEIGDFAQELEEPLGRLVNGLGGHWDELKDHVDLDAWVSHTDQLLQALPIEARRIEDWYRLGFELAILHNLAGQQVLDGTDTDAEQRFRAALERFLMRAERAEIGYENLGRVLGLLENLAGPRHERDLSNIGRSLDELRRYAAADDIHTAA